MAGGVNKVTLVGRLGKDPESRSTSIGRVVNLRVATSETWRDKQSGERREKTEWHQVVIYNEKIGEVAEKYLKKGSQVYLEGKLQTRKYEDSSGSERYVTEIVLAQYRGELQMLGDSGGGGSRSDDRESGGSESSGGSSSRQEDFDDIPF